MERGMSRFQLYQRLRTQATRLFGSRGARPVRVIRTEVIVEQEQRLWLVSRAPVQGNAPAVRNSAAGPIVLPLSEPHAALPPAAAAPFARSEPDASPTR